MSEEKQYITDRIKKAKERIVKANKKTKLAHIIIVICIIVNIVNAIIVFILLQTYLK